MRRTGLISEVRVLAAEARKHGRTIGFVPTMGYLHQGHLELVSTARREDCFTIMSIFVNPLQFGPTEDFNKYPRDLERDAALAEGAGVDLLFHPQAEEMYPEPMLTFLEVDKLGDRMCGASRPGHFRGVTTVVGKLFNIVQPDKAYFGEKDFQQLQIIKRMVKDLQFPVEIVGVPIVREVDGLARSSRNVFLSPGQRSEALVLSRSLREAADRIRAGEHDTSALEIMIKEKIEFESHGEIDYVEVRRTADLERPSLITGEVVIALAVRFGTTRLIDNTVVEVK